MRKLDTQTRAAILSSLVEGNSIASTCRMLSVSKVTVLRLLADAGTIAAEYHDLVVCNLETKRVQMDEIWSFCHSKHKNVRSENAGKGHGDVWTWVAVDADSKLVINWTVGGRSAGYAREFVADTASRLTDRVQLTSDAWVAYRDAVQKAFGDNVDYAMLVKQYKNEGQGAQVRYSPAECIGAIPTVQIGSPDERHISTSFVERQNLTMRMGMRRFTRLTNGFSKRIENHKHAIALHYFHYNFIRKHQTIKTTPALMAGVADRVWTMLDFVNLLEREERYLGGRLTNYKPAASKKV